MKTPKNLDTLLSTTKKIPTEMDIARIDAIVATFPQAGPAPGTSSGLPKLLTVLGLTVSLGLLIAYFTSNSAVPEVAYAAPAAVPELTPPDPIEPQQAAAVVAVADDESPSRRPSEPVVDPLVSAPPVLAPNPMNIAPATSPEPVQTDLPRPQVPKKSGKSKVEDALPFGETILTGTWQWNRDRTDIFLEHEERVNGRKITWSLPMGLSPEEARLLFPRGATTSAVQRETGRVILMEETKEFSFQERTAVRNRFEDIGWGTLNVRAEDVTLHGMQQGVSLAKNLATDKPQEITWLRYFTNNINDDYLTVLSRVGLPRAELSQLWRVADLSLTAEELDKQANRLQAVGLAGRNMTMELFVETYRERYLLGALAKAGYRVSGADWKALLAADVDRYYVQRAAENCDDATYTVADLIRLKEAGVNAGYIKRFCEALGTVLSVEELIHLKENDFSPKDWEEMAAKGVKISNFSMRVTPDSAPPSPPVSITYDVPKEVVTSAPFPREREGWTRRTEELPAITKLVVSDEIRVRVVKGTRNRATISTNDALGGQIKTVLDVSANGTLKIDSRLRPLYFLSGSTRAEVILEVTDLTSVTAAGGARVTVGDGVELAKAVAKRQSLVLLEGGLEGVDTRGSVGVIRYGVKQ